MHKITIAALILIALAAVTTSTANAISVGVKKGDWIEYQVDVTGDMTDHNAQWARMDVIDVHGSVLNMNMTTQFTNGTYLYENIALDLQTGQLGDDFFIPANLSPGDAFYDIHEGNITITSSEHRNYAGADRAVLAGHTDFTTFFWDKQTGVLVEAYSNYPSINFTMKTVTDKTNMWQPQALGPNTSLIYAVSAASAAAIIAAVLYWRRRSQNKK